MPAALTVNDAKDVAPLADQHEQRHQKKRRDQEAQIVEGDRIGEEQQQPPATSQ